MSAVYRQACIRLANHLIADREIVHSAKVVLELGAGVGLLSLVAARLAPAISVLSSDVDDQVLLHIENNVARSQSLIVPPGDEFGPISFSSLCLDQTHSMATSSLFALIGSAWMVRMASAICKTLWVANHQT